MVVVLILASGAAWESAALGSARARARGGRAPPLRRRTRPARRGLGGPGRRGRGRAGGARASTWPRSTTCGASRYARSRSCPPARPTSTGCAPPGSASRRRVGRRPARRAARGRAGRRRRRRADTVVPDPLAARAAGARRAAAASSRSGDRPGRPGGRPSRWPSRPSWPPAAGVRRWSTPTPTAAPWPSSWASSTRSPDCSRRRGWRAAVSLEARFGSVQRAVGEHLTVVTGLPRPDRWVEVRAGAVEHLLEVAAAHGDVVVDTGFSLESDPAGEFGARPPRNQTTLAALGQADEVVVVGSADPVGLVAAGAGAGRPARGGRRRAGAGGGQPDAALARLVREGHRRHGRGLRPVGRACTSCPTTGRPSTGPWSAVARLAEVGESPLGRAVGDLVDAARARRRWRAARLGAPRRAGGGVRPRRAGRARRS